MIIVVRILYVICLRITTKSCRSNHREMIAPMQLLSTITKDKTNDKTSIDSKDATTFDNVDDVIIGCSYTEVHHCLSNDIHKRPEESDANNGKSTNKEFVAILFVFLASADNARRRPYKDEDCAKHEGHEDLVNAAQIGNIVDVCNDDVCQNDYRHCYGYYHDGSDYYSEDCCENVLVHVCSCLDVNILSRVIVLYV